MAAMVGGLYIYENIHLNVELRNGPFKADFLLCRISKDTTLGMKFLSQQDCSVACDKGFLVKGAGPSTALISWVGPSSALISWAVY